jgi:prevent-host-death family protein
MTMKSWYVANESGERIMTTMNVTQFKAHCLGILEKIRDTPDEVLLTKRGRVVAKIVPACDESEKPWEKLRGTAHFRTKDLLSEDKVWEDL